MLSLLESTIDNIVYDMKAKCFLKAMFVSEYNIVLEVFKKMIAYIKGQKW